MEPDYTKLIYHKGWTGVWHNHYMIPEDLKTGTITEEKPDGELCKTCFPNQQPNQTDEDKHEQ